MLTKFFLAACLLLTNVVGAYFSVSQDATFDLTAVYPQFPDVMSQDELFAKSKVKAAELSKVSSNKNKATKKHGLYDQAYYDAVYYAPNYYYDGAYDFYYAPNYYYDNFYSFYYYDYGYNYYYNFYYYDNYYAPNYYYDNYYDFYYAPNYYYDNFYSFYYYDYGYNYYYNFYYYDNYYAPNYYYAEKLYSVKSYDKWTCVSVTAPTAAPSWVPGGAPTFAPTKNSLVKFKAAQTLSGISLSTYNSAPSYETSVKQSIAASMDQVTPSMISNINATSSSTSTSVARVVRFRIRQSLASTDAIDISYEVAATIQGATYSSLTSQLNSNIANGKFNSYLTQYGDANGAFELAGVKSSNATTEDETTTTNSGSSTDDDSLSGGAIAGIVIGVIAFVVIVAAIIFFGVVGGFGSSSGDEKPASATSNSTTISKSTPAVQSNPVFGISAISNTKTSATPIEDSNM